MQKETNEGGYSNVHSRETDERRESRLPCTDHGPPISQRQSIAATPPPWGDFLVYLERLPLTACCVLSWISLA